MGMQRRNEDGTVPVGRIGHDGNGYVLAFDRQFDYPRAYVWDLLANPERLAQWLGELTPGWQQGKEYDLDLGGTRVSGTVLQHNPPTSLQLTWEDELDHECVLEWRVLESDGGTLLQFRAHAESADFLAEGGANWQVLLDRLAGTAAGSTPNEPPSRSGARPAFDIGARHGALRDAYAREFSVSPSTGSVDHVAGHPTARFERLIFAPPQDIWAALTEPDGLAQWLGPAVMSVQTGGSIDLDLASGPVRGDLTKVVPGQALEYSWSSPSIPESRVHWHLNPQHGNTWLRLTHVLLATETHASLPVLMAFWHQHLDALAVVLSGDEWHWSAHRNSALAGLYSRNLAEPVRLAG